MAWFFEKNNTIVKLKLLLAIVNRHKIALIVLAAILALNFWWVILHMNSALYGGPGDHTAGIMWLYDHYPQSPWWSQTELSAYPWGEKLWSPLFLLGQVGYILFWICAKIMGSSVGGYNLFTGIAFTLSFVVTYGFIYKRLLNIKLLAALLSIVITFTPMALLLNAVGHTSYLFMPAYLFGVIWCILNIFETKKRMPIVILGVLGGLTILFDPYFILFIPLAAASFTGTLLALRYYRKFDLTFKKVLVRVFKAILVSLIIIVPALLYVHSQSSDVAAISANSRGDQVLDATLYSARLADYILPSMTNPLAPAFVKDMKSATYHGQDATFTLYLGWSLIVALVVACCWWLLHPKPSSKKASIFRAIGLSALVMGFVAFLFSLPPNIVIAGIQVHTPTWYLATNTPVWRVFARLYFVVQPAILLACIAWFCEFVMSMSQKKRQRVTYVSVIVFCFVLLIEYLPRNPLDTGLFWSYTRDLPTVYTKLSQEKDQVVAEYPMREQPYYRGSLYLTGQHLYSHPTINSYSPTSPSAYSRVAIMDLDNPQTVPALRYLGATRLVVWNNNRQHWNPSESIGLQKIHSETYDSKFEKNQVIESYEIKPGVSYRYVAVLQSGHRPSDEGRIYGINVPIQSSLSIAAIDLCQGIRKACAENTTSFNLKMTLNNNTDGVVKIVLKSVDNNDEKILVLQKGENEIEFSMESSRYIFEFDTKFNNSITLTNQRIVQ